MNVDLLKKYRMPILATCSTILMWEWFLLFMQRGVKYSLKREYRAKNQIFNRYSGQPHPRMLSVDRIVINTQEQMIPFLLSMWMYSVFIDPDFGGKLGFAWVILRIGYSFLMPKELQNSQPKRVFLATGPQYAIIAYYIINILFNVV